jgi:hypothetical protein
MKIDVEGFEKRTLKGLRQTLIRQRPIIVCELSYCAELSFNNREDFVAAMPEDYEFFVFDIRKPDGSKARRKGAKAKRSGYYRLIPHRGWRDKGQDDIVACPTEKVELLPLESLA